MKNDLAYMTGCLAVWLAAWLAAHFIDQWIDDPRNVRKLKWLMPIVKGWLSAYQ